MRQRKAEGWVSGKTRTQHMGTRVAMAAGMLLLAVLLLYPGKKAPSQAVTPAAMPEETQRVIEAAVPTEEPVDVAPALSEPVMTQAPESAAAESTAAPDVSGAEAAAEQVPQESIRSIVYDQRSYQLVTDMVYAYRMQLEDRGRIIEADVAALKEHDEPLGEAWGGIMEYWDYADTKIVLNFDRLPEDLPKDNSLCIVVLGFQLLPDGSMAQEMLGRCELALAAAQQYPNAYLAVTGGGTAAGNVMVTEAGVMAEWFLEQGIDESRIILEDRSSTTDENAKFTLKILTEQYPQIRSIAIVTSDYHVPLGCTLFTEAALLYGCEHGRVPWSVDAHVALRGYGLTEYTNPAEQALYIWALANPQLN